MALTFWIEAINSGVAKEHIQKAPHILCQYYPVSGVVFHEWYTPNVEVSIAPLALPIL